MLHALLCHMRDMLSVVISFMVPVPGSDVAKVIMRLESRVLQTFYGIVTAIKVCVFMHLKNSILCSNSRLTGSIGLTGSTGITGADVVQLETCLTMFHVCEATLL